MTVRSCQTQTAYTGSVTHGVSEQGVGTHPLYPTKLRLHFKSRATSDAGYHITPPGYQSTAMVRTLPASTQLCSLSTVISICASVSVVLGMEAKLQQARFYYAAMYPAQMRKQGELWQPNTQKCHLAPAGRSCLAAGTFYSAWEDNSMAVPSTADPESK